MDVVCSVGDASFSMFFFTRTLKTDQFVLCTGCTSDYGDIGTLDWELGG
jgi:hypothetical protein